MKYKYKIFKQKYTDYPYRVEEELSRIGEDGWELVNVIKVDNDSNSLLNYQKLYIISKRQYKRII